MDSGLRSSHGQDFASLDGTDSDRAQSRGVLPPPVYAEVAIAEAMRLRSSAQVRVSDAPRPVSTRVSPPRPATGMSVHRARAAEAEAAPTEAEQAQYRISQLPTDTVAEVSVAQGLARVGVQGCDAFHGCRRDRDDHRRRRDDPRARQHRRRELGAIEPARDAVHPDGATTTPSSQPWQRARVTLQGAKVENGLGQETFADCEVNFSHNGASLGYVEVSVTRAEDAWGWGLVVRETLSGDPVTYTDSTGRRFAALKLRFHYRFDHSPLQDVIAIADLTIYGNGAHALTFRWTQP